jgi:hypothetical protein
MPTFLPRSNDSWTFLSFRFVCQAFLPELSVPLVALSNHSKSSSEAMTRLFSSNPTSKAVNLTQDCLDVVTILCID